MVNGWRNGPHGVMGGEAEEAEEGEEAGGSRGGGGGQGAESVWKCERVGLKWGEVKGMCSSEEG
jgi:hypothetical protein